MRWLYFVFCLTVAACGRVDYDELSAGEFEGSLLVLWIEGGRDKGQGDGVFVYVPMPGEELVFRRKDPRATVKTIRPAAIYTDGGSIPRAAQVFRGFNPWGYAPAYLIHDWLFVARKCLNDGAAQGSETDIADMQFIESARVLGEAIKTLVETNKVSGDDVAPELISRAVAGPISRNLWQQTGECQSNRLTKEDQEKVDKFTRRNAVKLRTSRVEDVPDLNDVSAVAVVEF